MYQQATNKLVSWLDRHRLWVSGFTTCLSLGVCLAAFWYGVVQREEILVKEQRLQVYRDMISSTSYAFVVLDPHGKIVEWGPGAVRLFGWEASEVLGSDPSFLMPEEFREKHKLALSRDNYDFARSLTDVDCYAYTKQGELIPIHIVAASFRNHNGFFHAALISKRDAVKRVDTLMPRAQSSPPPPSSQWRE